MNEMPVGEPGECVVRGPGIMSGYLDHPQANQEVFASGWLTRRSAPTRAGRHTDLCRPQEYLIKTGGEIVYPAEVNSHRAP